MCERSGAPLTPEAATAYRARQVFDLPEPQPLEVTEHRAHSCRCTQCGASTQAAFPAGVTAPVQYGARITAWILYLLHYQFIPEDRLVELMADLFGVKLAAATLARFQGFMDVVYRFIQAAAVKHLDETGFRIGGKTQWLHIAATRWLTFYRTAPKRGSRWEGLLGIVVHDHWKPYYTLTGLPRMPCATPITCASSRPCSRSTKNRGREPHATALAPRLSCGESRPGLRSAPEAPARGALSAPLRRDRGGGPGLSRSLAAAAAARFRPPPGPPALPYRASPPTAPGDPPG